MPSVDAVETLDTASDTESLKTLAASLRASLYRIEAGRRLRNVNEDYSWPCDSTSAQFELLAASALTGLYRNGLYFEPEEGMLQQVLERPGSRIFDLGSGLTAGFAISMAERFPHCEVIGVDLTPPGLDFFPSNLEVEIHDLLEGLPYPDDYFSLIHARQLCFSKVFSGGHPNFLLEISRCLRPGGVLLLEEHEDHEIHQNTSSLVPNPQLQLPLLQRRNDSHISNLFSPGTCINSRLAWGRDMGRRVRETEGFLGDDASVVDLSFDIPFGSNPNGPSPKTQRGALVRDAWLAGWELHSALNTGMDEKLMAELKELDRALFPEDDVGLFFKWRVVWTRKASS